MCRIPFRTSVKDLPTNFVIQKVIEESLRSSEWICQDCCAERKLELATTRCQDCLKTLCDSCGTEHADVKHELKSLMEKKCEDHQQKLDLICLECEKNICVICFSEDHQDHKCDAIDKVTEQLTEMVKTGVEELDSSGRHLESVFTKVTNPKIEYETRVVILNECLYDDATGHQRTRAAEEAFQSEKGQNGVEGFIRMKLSAVNEVIELDRNGETVDFKQVRDLVSDISVVVVYVVFELDSHATALQLLLSDMRQLKMRATDIMLRSASKYDMAENRAEITDLHDEIQAFMHTFFKGKKQLPAMHNHNL